jgi:hypothetical protein
MSLRQYIHAVENENFESLLGKTIVEIKVSVKNDAIYFTLENGDRYKMYHAQDCCEEVLIDDINGNLEDLIGYPITMAQESTNSDQPKNSYDKSCTWTFYKLATIKGFVDIKWYGVSNGCYSEFVTFKKVENVLPAN